MKIHLIAVGKRLPDWVNTGYLDYAKRFPEDYALQLHEVSAGKRTKTADIERLIRKEGEEMLARIPENSRVIALNIPGKLWDTPTLARKLHTWHDEQQNISLLIGGPEGLAPACLKRADMEWSLSPLTLPHPLVRIIVAEQLYRAWSIIVHHPYHRETD